MTSRLPRTERHTSLYGDVHGNWMLLESVTGTLPPPDLHAYVYENGPPPRLRVLHCYGSPRDLVTTLCNELPAVVPGDGHGSPVQRTAAALLGVTQQSVSRYLNQGIEPDLPEHGWQQLARLASAWTERPGHPADLTAVRDMLTAATSRQEGT